MAAFDYTGLANDAKQLVADFGRTATFIKFDETPADAAKPWRGNLTPRETPADSKALLTVFAHPSSATQLGLTIREEDFTGRETQIAMIAPGSTDLTDYTTYDEVLDGTTRWKITRTERLKPGSTVMIYFFFLER
jgi:hypothetical protein